MAVIAVRNSPQAEYEIPAFPLCGIGVTPSDTDTYSPPVTVYVGGAGNVAVECGLGANTVTFSNIPAGSVLPMRVTRVLATGTTATLMIGMA